MDNDVYLAWLGCVVNAFSRSPKGGGEEGRNRVEATPLDRGPRIATGGDPQITTVAAQPRERDARTSDGTYSSEPDPHQDPGL